MSCCSSCKAFDLDDAIASFAPAVGPQTAIIPLLNGMRHLDVLDGKFGAARVLGGSCGIAVTLNETRDVVQLAPMQSLSLRRARRQMSDRVRAIAEIFSRRQFRIAGQRPHHAGDVGEMGVPGDARGLHQR